MDPATIKAVTDLMSPTLTHAAKSAVERRAEKAAISDSLVGSLVDKFATVLSDADASDLARRMTERESAVKLRKQLNVEECLRLAVEIAMDGEPQERREVDQDWFFEWFACIENVSDELVQAVWARVLANNLDASKRAVSLRALDTLRLMDRADADNLARFARLASRVGVLFINDWSAVDRTVGRSELDVLLDLGVVVKEEYQLGRIGLPNAFTLVWERADGRVALDPFYAYRLSARGTELAQSLPEAFKAETRGDLIDFESPSGHAEYARVVASGFDDGCRVSLQFNLARYLNPEDPVSQRSRDVVTTHTWDAVEQCWRRSDNTADLPPEALASVEV
ncbi:MAG: DUF2806 domain-containing protein [Planctomycetota bacterium]